MIAQCVEKSGAWLDLRLALLPVHVENYFDVAGERLRSRRVLFSFRFGPQVIGNRGARAGDTHALQKPAPAWVVRLLNFTIVTRLGHCFSPEVVLLVKPFP